MRPLRDERKFAAMDRDGARATAVMLRMIAVVPGRDARKRVRPAIEDSMCACGRPMRECMRLPESQLHAHRLTRVKNSSLKITTR